MSEEKYVWCKISTLCLFIGLSIYLFLASFNLNYQWQLTREHVRFRAGFPSQTNWKAAPFGSLKCYLFNVTNSESFLNGKDSKLNVEEIGPIVYRIKGRHKVLNQTESTITYQKIRYEEAEFDAEASCATDILNQTIVMPNLVLLGAAAKLHDWVFFMRHAFNAITINEQVFLNQTIQYFLWDFTLPTLNLLASYLPNIVANCGILYNALKNKEEVYNVNIGLTNGVQNFFRVNTLNNKTFFSEQVSRLKFAHNENSTAYCPINVRNTFDNSLFPPFIDTTSKMGIVAGESCRTFQLEYENTERHLGFSAYRYEIADATKPTCLNTAMGIKLHTGIFDVSKCLFNDVPSAFSFPHFLDSSYNWSNHFIGLSPNFEYHKTSILIEPITGIPIEEKYRFQSNIPMPNMTGYSKELERFSEMIIPTFWYEYDLDDLPGMVLILMRVNIFLVPISQVFFMTLFFFTILVCLQLLFKLFKELNYVKNH